MDFAVTFPQLIAEGPTSSSHSYFDAVEALAAAYGYFYERFTDVDRAIEWLVD